MTKKGPYKGLGADSEEKHEPVSDIDTVVVDSLKVLDPKRPIREADIARVSLDVRFGPEADMHLPFPRQRLGDVPHTFDEELRNRT